MEETLLRYKMLNWCLPLSPSLASRASNYFYYYYYYYV